MYLFNVPQDAVSIDKGVPGGNALITRQHLKGRGLSSSVEAQESKTFTFAYSQRQPVHSQEICPAAVHLRRKETASVSW